MLRSRNEQKQDNINSDELTDICQTYFPRIYRFVSYRVSNHEEAEDLTGEVFLRLVRSKNGITGHIQAWLYRVAENVVTDYYRRNSVRKNIVEGGDDLNGYADPTSDASYRTKSYDIKMGLSHLTGDQYQVIILKFIEGYSTREIAAMMEKSEGAIKALQFRALKAMRDFFGEGD